MKPTVLYLFLGGLGVGKTTALRSILAQKPDEEIWGVVMNEFGAAGIDQLLLPDKESIPQITVSGGCICCAGGTSLVQTVQYLLDTYRPQRIFIEPSGWAHPAELRDQLKHHPWTSPVALGPICGLIDLVDWTTKRWIEHQSFWDMVHASDVLLATKPDRIDEDQLDEWFGWVEEIYPPKQLWDVLSEGKFNLNWLEGSLSLSYQNQPFKENARPKTSVLIADQMRVQKQPGGWSASWLFSSDIRFDLDALTNFLEVQSGMVRVKGIFQLAERALVWQWVRGQSRCEWVTYDRDSRLEILAAEPLDWDAWDQGLRACQVIQDQHTKINQ